MYAFFHIVALGENYLKFDDIKDLRKTTDVQKRADVITFYQDIVPCLAGRREWEMNHKFKMISDIVTPSLEAMALWIIDNYSEKWSRKGKRTEKAKYTCIKQGNKLFGGWNESGIEKFNNLVRHVRKNREEDDNFEKMFLTLCQAKDDARFERVLPSKPSVCCLDDLDDDDSSADMGITENPRKNTFNVPTYIDVCQELDEPRDIRSPDMSVASRSSSSTRASRSSYHHLYGSFTGGNDTVRNRAEI